MGVAGAVIIFGGATVLLKDPVFIFWKPTVFNWALAGVSVVWHVMRGKCLFEDLLPDEIEMPKHIWKRVTVASTLHFYSRRREPVRGLQLLHGCVGFI